MDNIADLFSGARQLAHSIVEHEVFARYREAKAKMEAQPDLAERLERLRMLEREFSQGGKPMSEKQVQIIQNEFADIKNRPEVVEFLSAEGQFMRLINDIQDVIQKVLNNNL